MLNTINNILQRIDMGKYVIHLLNYIAYSLHAFLLLPYIIHIYINISIYNIVL